jgi:formylglycine-generating enzyme required for sulfatase activity
MVSLILLMAAGCTSNPPAFKTGLSKHPSPGKFSVRAPKKNRPAESKTFAKRHPEKLPSISSRSPAKKKLLPTLANKKDGSLLVLVHSGAQQVSLLNPPQGTIRPGSRADRSKYFPAFYMDRLEITVSQYKMFDGKYNEKLFMDGKECPDCPAMGIDWIHAQRYCLWAGKRLPTEKEWMTAAGGLDNTWPWGNEFSLEKANLWGDQDGSPAVALAGSYPQGSSPYGLMDTVGNVWEWTSDSYFAPADKSKKNRLRIVKGGGWTSDKRQARIGFRNFVDPKIKNPTIGFRCVKPIQGKGWNHS